MRLLAMLLLLGAASAFAEDAAHAYMRAAQMLYQKLEYEKALDQLERARKVATGIADDVRISLWEGILLSELGRLDEARTAFNTALALSIDAKLPVKVSPKVSGEFEKLRVQARKELAQSAPLAPVVPNARPLEPPPPVPPPALVEAPAPPGKGARRFAPIAFAIGGAGAVAGIVGGVVAGSAAGRLRSETLSPADGQRLRDTGATFQLVGFVGLGVGVAGLLAGTLMAALGGPPDSALTLAPVPGGAAVGLRVTLP